MPRPATNAIYEAFISSEHCILTTEHRQELHENRGFSDDLIEAARLKSARPENTQVIAALQEEFEREALIDAGILTVVAGHVAPNSMLLQPRILIPYLNEQHEAHHLRPHKLGFRGVPIQPYFAGQGSGIVLAESEFKAMASYAFGFSAIGIPGISSFAREHYRRLNNHIIEEGITRATIIFDNEVKDDPILPGYKDDPDKRWDTDYYACLMASRINESANIPTRVGRLPDEWRVNGKVDIDAALAQGRTQDEFAAVVNGALRWEDYLNGLPVEAQRVIRRKMRAFYLSLRIKRTGRGYEIYEEKAGGGGEWKSISNFMMNIVGRIETTAGTVRDVRFVSEMGQPSAVFRMEGKHLVKPDTFQEALYGFGSGECQFRGSKEDLADVINLEHARSKESIIVEPDHVGKVAGKDLWLFGNGAIMNGEFVPAGDNRTCWNAEKGYRAANYIGSEVEDENISRWQKRIPYPDFENLDSVDLKEIARRLYKNFGGERGGHHALLAFAWGLSCAHSHEFYEEFGSFPLLYLIGPKESGKSTIARWICRMYGITIPGLNVDAASNVGVGRLVAYYSSLPAFLDEAREHSLKNTGKETLLRSVYDRQPVVKGTREASNRMRITVVRAPVMLSGEQVPTDPALNTRCLFPAFSTTHQGWGSEYQWLEKASRKDFARILPWILLRGPAVNDLLDKATSYYNELKKEFSPRVALNYAVAAASYIKMADPEDELGFLPWIAASCQVTHRDQLEDDELSFFFEDLDKLKRDNEIKAGTDYEVRGGKLFMCWRRCWEAWEARQKKLPDRTPMRSNTSLKLLRQKPYLEDYNRPHRFGNQVHKCIVINLAGEELPPDVLVEFCVPHSTPTEEPKEHPSLF